MGCVLEELTNFTVTIQTHLAQNSKTADNIVFTFRSSRDVDDTDPVTGYTLQRAQLTSTSLTPNPVIAGSQVASIEFGGFISSRGRLVGGNQITLIATDPIFYPQNTPFQASLVTSTHSGTACNKTNATTLNRNLTVVLAPSECDMMGGSFFKIKIDTNLLPNVDIVRDITYRMVSTADFDTSELATGYTTVVPQLQDASISIQNVRASVSPMK